MVTVTGGKFPQIQCQWQFKPPQHQNLWKIVSVFLKNPITLLSKPRIFQKRVCVTRSLANPEQGSEPSIIVNQINNQASSAINHNHRHQHHRQTHWWNMMESPSSLELQFTSLPPHRMAKISASGLDVRKQRAAKRSTESCLSSGTATATSWNPSYKLKPKLQVETQVTSWQVEPTVKPKLETQSQGPIARLEHHQPSEIQPSWWGCRRTWCRLSWASLGPTRVRLFFLKPCLSPNSQRVKFLIKLKSYLG